MSRASKALLLLCGVGAPLPAQVRTREIPVPLSTEKPAPSAAVLPVGIAHRGDRLTAPMLAISVDTISPFSLGIRWTPVSAAAEYWVSHAVSASGPWGLITRLPGSTTRLDDQNLAPSATIYYQVQAFSETGGTGQLATVTGSGHTTDAPRLVVTAACEPGANVNGEDQQRCTWTWQPMPAAVSYIVNDYSDGGLLGACPVRKVALATVTGLQYFDNEVPHASARCRHHFSFQAVYVMHDFPAAGQVQYLNGPETHWYPQ
jgi:hypothetical protein